MIKLTPVVDPNGSDSARLDNTLEFLLMSGMPLPLAMMITIPEPWENNEGMSREKREDRKSTRLNSSHASKSRMPSSA